VVQALLDRGANANAKDGRGKPVLVLAAGIPDWGAANVELLLDHGATYAPGQARTLLTAAVGGGRFPLFQKLVEKHGDSLFGDARANAFTMRFAVLGGSVEIVAALLAKGIAIDKTPDARGFNILHYLAIVPKAAAVIDVLVKNGFDIDARTLDGRTAFNLAQGARNSEAQRRLAALGASQEAQKFPVLTGPYLGQTPPTADPVPFAPGILIASHGGLAISPDGKEMYWSAPPRIETLAGLPRSSVIVTMLRDGRWTAPAVAAFSCTDESPCWDSDPFVSPDNKRLFFRSSRPVKPGAKTAVDTTSWGAEDVWFVERTPTGWSAARPLGPVTAPGASIATPAANAATKDGVPRTFSITKNGTLYFASKAGDICFSRLVKGAYAEPVSVGPAVNSAEVEACPFVAPDESYLIFSRASGLQWSYYISYRLDTGAWSQPVALNHLRGGAHIFVSADGKYVFFGATDGFWAPATFIEEMRPKGR
jgi:hypothetical protein